MMKMMAPDARKKALEGMLKGKEGLEKMKKHGPISVSITVEERKMMDEGKELVPMLVTEEEKQMILEHRKSGEEEGGEEDAMEGEEEVA